MVDRFSGMGGKSALRSIGVRRLLNYGSIGNHLDRTLYIK